MRTFYTKQELKVVLFSVLGGVLLICAGIIMGAIDCARKAQPSTVELQSQIHLRTATKEIDPDDVVDGFSKKKVHPKAQALMKQEFFWSILDDDSPFGNDTGWDTLSFFIEWHKQNPKTDPIIFVTNLCERFQSPLPLWKTITPAMAKSFFSFGNMYVLTTGDEIMIATAFGQLGIDGFVSKDLNDLARKAIQNEFEMADKWRDPIERKERLETMLAVLNKL